MTKLVRKSVDVAKVLSCPRQSWTERLMSWGMSKPAIASIFIMIMGWFGKAFAEDDTSSSPWDISLGAKVTAPFQYSRKIIFILIFLVMIICVILALFKKISWFWLFGLLSWLAFLAVSGYVVDYVTDDLNEYDILAPVFGIIIGLSIGLLPVATTLIQYKIKKIDKKLLKRRLLIWISCGLIIGGVIGLFGLLDLIRY